MHGLDGGVPGLGAALGQEVLDMGPAGRLRPGLDLAAQALADPPQALLGRLDAHEGLAVEGRVALGDEGREGEHEALDLCDLEGEAHELVGVGVGLAGRAHHLVDLHAVKAVVPDLLGGLEEVLLLDLALEDQAHALADAVRGDGDRSVAATLHVVEKTIRQAIGAQARDADAAAAVDQRGDQRLELRVIGDGGADQTDLTGVIGDEAERRRHREQPHASVGRDAHDTEAALARAAALGLDEEHVGELGVRGEDHGAGGETLERGLGGVW